MIDLEKINKIHCIGIGGVGISSLARLLVHQGKEVSGTNDGPSPDTLDGLRQSGVQISLDLDPANLPEADLYIYSDAWLTNNPEVLAQAKTSGKPCLSYFEALGLIASGYDVIAIAGTHGKTTTTSMVADVLEDAGLDPTVVVGSIRAKTKSNFQAGNSKWLVVEADEYRRHFLQFTPKVLAIINIDADHLDYYEDLADIQSAFRELVLKVPVDGVVICNPSDPNIGPVIKDATCQIVDYTKFIDPNLKLNVPGEHNRLDAGVVLTVADWLKISITLSRGALEKFTGTWRRFEYLGTTKDGVLVYDDYAHHPKEIQATLAGAREKWPAKKIVVVFQPHLYSRTKLLLNDFAGSFTLADEVIILPIYAARETADPTISHQILVDEISKHQVQVLAVESFSEAKIRLKTTLESGEVVITMGAGNVVEIAKSML
ncbi:MAG: UDP-N-acetylmuramate--L-alanine ligase [Candidatus Vogelbacteria bacterium]|nr:UDP-N-acetylmuramate--L-alanine ligase [Candidatus Vogelbacteria bacterium]